MIIMISIFTILTQSLATGYFTYFLLNKMDLLVLSIKKKDEKIAVVSFLSAFNLWVFSGVDQFIHNVWLSVLVTSVIAFLSGLFVFPLLLKIVNNTINKIRSNKNKLEFLNRSIRDAALDTDEVKYIYLFDFDGKYIASGYLGAYQYDTDEYDELLLDAPNEKEIAKSVDDVEKLYENYDVRILIDYQKRTKIYIIPMDEVLVD